MIVIYLNLCINHRFKDSIKYSSVYSVFKNHSIKSKIFFKTPIEKERNFSLHTILYKSNSYTKYLYTEQCLL